MPHLYAVRGFTQSPYYKLSKNSPLAELPLLEVAGDRVIKGTTVRTVRGRWDRNRNRNTMYAMGQDSVIYTCWT